MEDTFDDALRSADPLGGLRALVREFSAKGQTQAEILGIFETQRARLLIAGRETDQDAVTDVMDFIIGWCSPHSRLFESPACARRAI